MKEEMISVNSGGKEIGKIKVPTYEKLSEAVAALKEDKCLALINRQNKADITNAFRAASTTTTSPSAKLNKYAKSDPVLAKKIEDLVAVYEADAKK